MSLRSLALIAIFGAVAAATGCISPIDDQGAQDEDLTARGKSKAELVGSCESPKGQSQYCGGKTKSTKGNCYCDTKCAGFGDCCSDKVDVCGGKGNPVCTTDAANYIGKPEQCKVIKFFCVKGKEPFSDACGCGCKPIEEPCGGKLGLKCSGGFNKYCDYSATCGSDDTLGVCRPAGDVCAQVYEPVCGCDGKTYSNACMASVAHQSVVHKGECVDESKTCGGLAGKLCAKGTYCRYQNNSCGAGDQMGSCETRPDKCIQLYQPVCGCDGKTYSNSCMAHAGGTDVLHDTACEEPAPQKCGDKTCNSGQWCQFCWGKMACIPKGALC